MRYGCKRALISCLAMFFNVTAEESTAMAGQSAVENPGVCFWLNLKASVPAESYKECDNNLGSILYDIHTEY